MLSLIQKSGPSSEAPNLRLKMISDNLLEKNGQSPERFVTDVGSKTGKANSNHYWARLSYKRQKGSQRHLQLSWFYHCFSTWKQHGVVVPSSFCNIFCGSVINPSGCLLWPRQKHHATIAETQNAIDALQWSFTRKVSSLACGKVRQKIDQALLKAAKFHTECMCQIHVWWVSLSLSLSLSHSEFSCVCIH